MQFKLWLEGKFDKETTDISRIVIKALKENIDKISEQRNVLFFSGDINSIIGIVKNPKLITHLPETNYNLIVLVGSDRFLSVSGRYNMNRNLIRINIIIPTARSQFPYIIDKLIPKLKSVIRHELAYVSGLYKMSKTLKKPFIVVLNEFLEKINISNEEKEEIRKIYLNYQKARFPKALI